MRAVAPRTGVSSWLLAGGAFGGARGAGWGFGSSRGAAVAPGTWQFEAEVLVHRDSPARVEAVRETGVVSAPNRAAASRLAREEAERRHQDRGYLVRARVTTLFLEEDEDLDDAPLAGDLLG